VIDLRLAGIVYVQVVIAPLTPLTWDTKIVPSPQTGNIPKRVSLTVCHIIETCFYLLTSKLFVCSLLYVFICLPEMVNKDK